MRASATPTAVEPEDSAVPVAVVMAVLSDGGARPAMVSEPVRTITPSLLEPWIPAERVTLESEMATDGTTVTPLEPPPASALVVIE